MKKLILIVLSLFLFRLNSFALPEVETVVEGSAEITNPDSNTLQITATDNTILNYKSFDIKNNETVIITLPSIDSQILNRVLGDKASFILGNLNSNGILILINSNGIFFGPNSNVDVAGLIASTRDITNSNFLSSKYVFEKLSPEQLDTLLLNKGKINIKEGGFGILIAGAIENEGTIIAPVGTIAFAAGDMVSLDISTDGLISIAIDKPTASKVYDLEGNPITSQIKNTGTLQADDGVVLLKAEALPGLFEHAINLEGYVKANKTTVKDGRIEIVSSGDVLINGRVEAEKISIGKIGEVGVKTIEMPTGVLLANLTEVYKSGDIRLTNSYIQDNLITLEGEGFKVTYLANSNLTLQADNAINTTPGLIIQANQLKLIAKQFGSLEVPLNLSANLTYIYRLSGNIDILESLGLGTSIMLRGPPASGFGAIIYNSDTSLTLEAPSGSLSLGSAVSLVANNLTLISLQGIYSYGNLVADESITLKSQGPIISHGSLKTSLLIEEGASFSIGGTYQVGYAYLTNLDNAVTLETGNYTGETSDIADIIVNTNAVITLTGNTVFRADSDTNGTGAFTMNTGSSIVGGGFNLDIYASQASTLRAISGVGTLTIYESQASSNPTYTANNAISVTNFTISTGTFDAGAITLTVSGNFSNSGTFTANASTVTFNKSSATQTLNSGGSSFYKITHSGAGTLQLVTNNLTVTNDFTNSAGIFDLNAKSWIMTNATFSNTATVQLIGSEAITGLTQDTNSGTFTYVGNNSGGPNTYNIADLGGTGVDYYKLTINSTDTGANADTFQLTANLDVNNTLTITNGTLDVTNTNYQINFAGSWSNSGTFNAQGGKVVWDYTSNLTLNLSSGGSSFYQLEIAPTGGGTLRIQAGTLTVTNDLTITAGTFYLNGQTWTMTGATFSNLGTLQLIGSEVINGLTQDTNSGTWLYKYDFDDLSADTYNIKNFGTGVDYYHLTIDSVDGDIYQLTADLDVDGNLTINTLGTLDVTTTNYQINVGGSFSNSGAFTARSGKVVFDKASLTQTLNAGSSTFYQIEHSGAGTLQLVTNNLTVTNDFTNSAGIFDLNAKNWIMTGATFSNTATVQLIGSEAITGLTQDTNSGTFTYVGNNSGGPNTYNIVDIGSGLDYFNLTLNSTDTGANADTFQLTAALDVDGDLTITSGILDVVTTYQTNVAGNFANSGTFTARSGKVVFDKASSTQTLNSGGASFYQITHSGAGALQLITNDLTVTNDFTNSAGVFDLNGRTWIMTNAGFSNTATVKLIGSETITGLAQDTNSGTFTYVGNNSGGANTYNLKDFGSGVDYFNLTINSTDTGANADTFQLTANLKLNGGLTISSGILDVTTSNYNINLAGDWSNSGTFTARGGIVFLDGTGLQQITTGGSSSLFNILAIKNTVARTDFTGFTPSDYYAPSLTSSVKFMDALYVNNLHLTFDNVGYPDYYISSGMKRIEFASGLTHTVYLGFNLSGTPSYLIQMLSTNPGTQWTLNAPTGITLNYVFVTDSNTVNPITANKSFNGGNNTNWTFGELTFSGTGNYSSTGLWDFGYLPGQYDAVRISGTSTLTAGYSAKSMTVDASSILDLAGYNLTATNGVTLSGTLRLKGSETITGTLTKGSGSTVIYTGNTSYTSLSAGTSYTNLTFNGTSGSWTLPSNITVSNNITISAGTLNLSSSNLTVSGDFTINGGSLSSGTGKVVFSDSSKVTHVYGTNFTDLEITEPGKEVQFEAGSTETITGTLTITGAAGNLIKLRSTVDGSQWKIDPQGTWSISYADVKDSWNIHSTTLSPTSSTDTGNNTNWFPSTSSSSSSTNVEQATKATDTTTTEITLVVESTTGTQELELSLAELVSLASQEESVSTTQEEAAQETQEVGEEEEAETKEGAKEKGPAKDYEEDSFFPCEGGGYQRCYRQGKYRTIVIVFEGRVLVSPYDEKGAQYQKTKVLTTGQSTSAEEEVK